MSAVTVWDSFSVNNDALHSHNTLAHIRLRPCFVWSPSHVTARREWHLRSGISLPVSLRWVTWAMPSIAQAFVEIKRVNLSWEFHSCGGSGPSGEPLWEFWTVSGRTAGSQDSFNWRLICEKKHIFVLPFLRPKHSWKKLTIYYNQWYFNPPVTLLLLQVISCFYFF